jgi:hypothetical protein
LPLAAACGSSTTRTVEGQLQAGAYKVNNPVVIAQSADHHTYVSHVTATGAFKLNVPTGTSYRLLLANTTTTGYRAISRIVWPTKNHWVQLGAGPVVYLGTLHPIGTPQLQNAQVGNAQGENDDDQGEDEDEDDGAAICKAGDETDSEDDNDQGEQEGMNQDDNEGGDDMDADKSSSSMCGCAGTTTTSTQGEQDDDDEMEGGHSASGAAGGCGGTPGTMPPTTGGGTPPASGGTPPGSGTPSGSGGAGATCQVNGNCASGLICVSNKCQTQGPVLF